VVDWIWEAMSELELILTVTLETWLDSRRGNIGRKIIFPHVVSYRLNSASLESSVSKTFRVPQTDLNVPGSGERSDTSFNAGQPVSTMVQPASASKNLWVASSDGDLDRVRVRFAHHLKFPHH